MSAKKPRRLRESRAKLQSKPSVSAWRLKRLRNSASRLSRRQKRLLRNKLRLRLLLLKLLPKLKLHQQLLLKIQVPREEAARIRRRGTRRKSEKEPPIKSNQTTQTEKKLITKAIR